MIGEHRKQRWNSIDEGSGYLPRRHRVSGEYEAYIPPELERTFPLYEDTDEVVHQSWDCVRQLDDILSSSGLTSLNEVLVRSEAMYSSAIEGVNVSARNLALAQYTGQGKTQQRLVIRNIDTLQSGVRQICELDRVTADDIEEVHARFLPDHGGLRRQPVWIGQSPTPIGARYNPAPHDEVPRLMENLCEYINESRDHPIVKAAVVHAQFETIHPFTDGNGRVGRALVHAVLRRDGELPEVSLPVSSYLFQNQSEYISNLEGWRSSEQSRQEWIMMMADSVEVATQWVDDISSEMDRRKEAALNKVERLRGRAIRSESVIPDVVSDLGMYPVVTVNDVAQRYGKSVHSSRLALEELREAGVLNAKRAHQSKQFLYIADDILSIPDSLAQTFNMKRSYQPVSLPSNMQLDEKANRVQCDYFMPMAQRRCSLRKNHLGQHR